MKTGIDLVKVDRFFNKPENFYKKIFTQTEIDYCLKSSTYAEHFAGHFACKEAVMKALGVGIDTLSCLDIEILHNKDTHEPYILLKNNAKTHFEKLFNKNNEISISISHTNDYATAICVIV